MNNRVINDKEMTNRVISLSSLMVVGGILLLLLQLMSQPSYQFADQGSGPQLLATIEPTQDIQEQGINEPRDELTLRFEQAVAMLHAKQYDYAMTALHRVIALSPRMPEAYVNMGYALLGLERYKAAQDFFQTAIDMRPYQGNAYWGLAIALEKKSDLPGALGAMRTYIHLAPANDPYVRKARSALWEWESELERGPLPKVEAEWIQRKTKQWDDRNSPDQDRPDAEKEAIKFKLGKMFNGEAKQP